MKILALLLTLLSCAAYPRSPERSHIIFNAEVDGDSVEAFVKELKEADSGDSPIVVEINTPGGSVFAGFQMSRAIEQSKNQVVCVVDGMAASMGLYILQSCDVRIMTARSLLMGHQPGAGAQGQQDELKKMGVILEKLNLVMAAHITSRMSIGIDEYLSLVAHGAELWLTPTEALAIGAIDSKVSSVRDVLAK